MSAGDPRPVLVEDIDFDRRCWPRSGEPDPGRIAEFADLYAESGVQVLPPISLVPVDEKLVVADGVHRSFAAAQAGMGEIPAIILQVPLDMDPIEFAFRVAVKASTRGHKELSPAEKRRGIERLIAETAMSDEEIAGLFSVSRQTVWRRRRAVAAQHDASAEAGPGERYLAREGAREAAPRLLRALEKVRESRGLGFRDALFGDRMGERFAGMLRDAFADDAVDRAVEYRAWIEAAIAELQKHEAAT